ncbi:MAG: diaminopimelate decarboxylase, partial [Pseudomonadota bacterium]
SGVGKTQAEMRRALQVGIRCFNVESAEELERLEQTAAELGRVAPVSLRVNPDVDAQTHPYISTGLKENKFGVAMQDAVPLFRRAAASEHLQVAGADCHIGSQLTRIAPFLDALDRLLVLVDELRAGGIEIGHLDLGGGLGVRYTDETPPEPADYARALHDRLAGRDLEILLEPGRAIAANAGILLTRVEYLKHTPFKNFAIVDAAMNDLLRPALYDAVQEIIPARSGSAPATTRYDIVGPVCETGDFLGRERALDLHAGDLLAVRTAGAYGFTMSSNYNSRPRPAEIMVDGSDVHLVRPRETLQELFASESLLP